MDDDEQNPPNANPEHQQVQAAHPTTSTASTTPLSVPFPPAAESVTNLPGSPTRPQQINGQQLSSLPALSSPWRQIPVRMYA
ncbi:unnamed protein product, partial [Amoebophrya sp. A120]|eukprot:GSA120T00026361001.1